MLHLFPIEVAAAEGQPDVTMQVSKFYYGKWRSHQFEVRPGEMIGDLVETEDKEEADNARMIGMMGFGGEGIGSKLDKVDYSSNSILVDVVQMTDMAGVGALRSRKYSEVLCSSDGLTIAHLPVSKRNWPKNMRSKFEKIANAESEQVQIRGARGGGDMGMDMMMIGR